MSMLEHINNGWVINVDFREDNESPVSNSFYFTIGTLAYNLFLLFKGILDANL